MSHTAEPWCVGNTRTVKYATGESTETAIHYGDEESRGNCIAMTYGHFGFDGSEADARRIVACVNACAGISTENLEENVAIKELVTRYNSVLRQRDLAVKTLAEAKSNLMHHRRFGTDTFQAWKNAATRTEGDIEEVLATIRDN